MRKPAKLYSSSLCVAAASHLPFSVAEHIGGIGAGTNSRGDVSWTKLSRLSAACFLWPCLAGIMRRHGFFVCASARELDVNVSVEGTSPMCFSRLCPLMLSPLRHHLIALGIAVDILGCTGAVAERAATLHKIIQVAVELWKSAGDLFALSAVMKALQLPQVSDGGR